MSPPPPSSKRLILVVDDDADIREALCDTLADEGYPVAAVASGPEALAYLRSRQPLPALIFLDWNMAPMNAPQLMVELAKEPALAALPVVVVTAEARASQQVAAGRYQGFILKPVDLDQLFAFATRFAGSTLT